MHRKSALWLRLPSEADLSVVGCAQTFPTKLEDQMTQTIVWDDIPVSISHTPNWLNTEHHHIELRAEEKLPVTETGYRSHFIHQDEFALFESVAAFVEQWLDGSAKSPEWIRHKEENRQLSLF